MREYAKLAPTFWTGETGKAIRRRGSEGVVVALYLVSSPHSNMLGLYYQPVMYMAHETGLGIEGASKGLQSCIECGFCSYDADTEMVWVHEMAAWQISDGLSSADKRCKGIQKDYEALPANPFLGAFFDRYEPTFHLTTRRPPTEPSTQGPYQAPSKPDRSQEQEQEQEQESENSKPLRSPKVKAVNWSPPEWMPIEDWSNFVAMRKAKGSRAPFTPGARDGIVSDLAKLRTAGHDIAAVLQTSVKNGWSGVFAPKPAPGRPGGDDLNDLFRRGAA